MSASLLLGAWIAASDELPAASPHRLHWTWDPWVLASIAAVVIWYALGVARLRRKNAARVVRPSQVSAFVAGVAIVFIALESPLDEMGEQLFSAHMAQHLLLLLVAPPLLVYARPTIVWLWAFPSRQRKRLGRAWIATGLGGGLSGLMHPLIAWILFCGAFAFWHFPRPYEWALRNEAIHVAEHLSFFMTALIWWTIVIEPLGRRRLSYGGTLIFILATAVVSGMPGALMVLTPRPLYQMHEAGAASWGLTSIEDQQLAGILMWIPGGIAFIGAASVIFLKWLESAEPSSRSVGRAAGNALLGALIALALAVVGHGARAQSSSAGNPERGAALIHSNGCGGCHTIPGIQNADGLVGPPLTHFAERIYVAGLLLNTPDQLERWLRYPQKIVPGNAMPDMGISEKDARDIAAYLYTLR